MSILSHNQAAQRQPWGDGLLLPGQCHLHCIQKGEDHAELQLQLLPAPSTAAGGDGHSSPRVLPFAPCFAKGTLRTARGPKDQFVTNIIWESKLRCTGALQRLRAEQGLGEGSLLPSLHHGWDIPKTKVGHSQNKGGTRRSDAAWESGKTAQ